MLCEAKAWASLHGVPNCGVGLPADLDLDTSRSLGLHLVTKLTGQLGGSLDVGRAGGTTFTLTFPNK